MSRYKPAVGAHAIEQAVVGVRLFGTANDALFDTAVSKAAELALEYRLPGRVHLDPMALLFGKQVISPGYGLTGDVLPGVMFQRVAPDGSMAEELTVERAAVTYRTHSYRRWADVAALIAGIVCPVAEVLAQGDSAKIAVLELRCIDRFVTEPGDKPPLSELIADGSPHIASGLSARDDLLHHHSGWFQEVSDSARTLVNLNVDLVELNSGQRSAAVLQVFSRQGSGPGGVLSSGYEFSSALITMFDTMHRADKILLKELLTPALCERIKLFPEGEPVDDYG